MRTSLSFASSSPTVPRANSAMSRHEALARLLAVLDPAEPVLPVAGQPGRGQRVLAEQADDVEALLGADERAAVALDVADVDQALDDRRARGRRADARSPSSPRAARRRRRACRRSPSPPAATRRSSAAAAWSPSRSAADLERPRRPRPARASAAPGRAPSSSSAAERVARSPRRRRRASRARRSTRPRVRKTCSRDRRLQARVLEHGVGVEDGEEAARRPCRRRAGRRRTSCRRGARRVRRDDRVVVGDLRVVDHAAERQRVEPGDVGRGAGVLALLADAARRSA